MIVNAIIYIEIPLVAGQFNFYLSIWTGWWNAKDWYNVLTAMAPRMRTTMTFSAGPRMSTRRNFCATALLQPAGGKGQLLCRPHEAYLTTWQTFESHHISWLTSWPDHSFCRIYDTSACMLGCWERPGLEQKKDIAIAYCCNQGHCDLLAYWSIEHLMFWSILERIRPKLKSVYNLHLFHLNLNHFPHFQYRSSCRIS